MRANSDVFSSWMLKKNIVHLSRKLDIKISEEIEPLIDKLLNIGLISKHEIIQFKEFD